MANCPQCGSTNAPDAERCVQCGQPLTAGRPLPAPSVPATPHTSRLAVASLALGLSSFFVIPVAVMVGMRWEPLVKVASIALLGAPVFGILAVVFGHLAGWQIRKSAGRQKGDELALAGLILGYLYLGIILLAILGLRGMSRI